MKHRHFHLLEKIQVQLAAVAALLVVHFGLWPMLRPSDPNDPVVFVATGSAGLASLFAAALWGLAALCALVTITARPEGGFLAALIGLGGMSLRSAGMRPLLWVGNGSLRGLYGQLLAEVALLLVIGALGMLAVGIVRWVVGRVRPKWLWRSPMAVPSDEESATLRTRLRSLLMGGAPSQGPGAEARTPAKVAQFLTAATVLSVVLIVLFLRSPDRGQVLFALFAGSTLGFLIAHQLVPAALPMLAWVVPLVIGAGFYMLAAVQVGALPPEKWMTVPAYARVLPVDWLTAGGGGALLGQLISSRIHEARHMEQQEPAEKA